jgi:hypothetical protein
MNHEQLTGFGAVRADVKSFGKKWTKTFLKN